MFGTCQYVHSDRGSSLMSRSFKDYLLRKGISTSRTTPYHPSGNAQCERYNGVIWKAVKCALKSRGMALEKWESVVPMVLDSIRSLLCTSTGDTPHFRFFKFTRRSFYGNSLPGWLCEPGPVLLRKFVRSGKNDDLVRKVQLIEANPMYARVRYDDGRESNVSLRDLARYPRDDEDGGEQWGKDAGDSKADDGDVDPEAIPDVFPGDMDGDSQGIPDVFPGDKDANGHVHMEQPAFPSDGNGADVERSGLRRSARHNKGVPPDRLGCA